MNTELNAMDDPELAGIIEFLRETERLKKTYRSSYLSDGRKESVAEHTWRLNLMALILADHFPEINMARVIKITIVHDLGEALNGDIPAPKQNPTGDKSINERRDLLQITEPLPDNIRKEVVALWDEYENASTAEAKIAKALDKLETIMQHNQGDNPDGFDYAYNLNYGTEYTAGHPVIESIRQILDEETARNARKSNE